MQMQMTFTPLEVLYLLELGESHDSESRRTNASDDDAEKVQRMSGIGNKASIQNDKRS
jgi:hypothetical protein